MTADEHDISWLSAQIKTLEENFRRDPRAVTDEALERYYIYSTKLKKIIKR